tara:strand:+ start:1296 stop:1598 length:303 start_codon:yes stop_codon:yes gene_type:complete
MYAKRKIPDSWNDQDRRNYIAVGMRRKNEHVLAYALIGVGGQLYYKNCINRNAPVQDATCHETNLGGCEEEDENETKRECAEDHTRTTHPQQQQQQQQHV